jgi:hypothetical protein
MQHLNPIAQTRLETMREKKTAEENVCEAANKPACFRKELALHIKPKLLLILIFSFLFMQRKKEVCQVKP